MSKFKEHLHKTVRESIERGIGSALRRGEKLRRYRCPYCDRIFDYEPIQASAAPDSPEMCYECLPDDMQKAYDEFQAMMAQNTTIRK